jgi:hypothetical protein
MLESKMKNFLTLISIAAYIERRENSKDGSANYYVEVLGAQGYLYVNVKAADIDAVADAVAAWEMKK